MTVVNNKRIFLQRLRRLCGDMLISDIPSLKVYETDGLTAKKRLPWLVEFVLKMRRNQS